MFLRQLNYLVALSQERHFTRAAERCHVSQPALSGAIRNLEEELGVPIVQRDRNFIGFTPEGERLLYWAQQILADWGSMRQDVNVDPALLSGTLRIGAIPTTLPAVARVTGLCRQYFPSVQHQVSSISNEEIIKRMDRFELDLGITYLNEDILDGFNIHPLYQEQHVLITQTDSALASSTEIPWEALADVPLCLLSQEMQNRKIIDAAFRNAGIQPQPKVETDSIMSLYTHIISSDLYSVIPHSLLSLFINNPSLTAIPMIPSLSRRISIITPNREPQAPLLNALWPRLQELDLQRDLDDLISNTYHTINRKD